MQFITIYPHEAEMFDKVVNKHHPSQCEGQCCVLHNPWWGPWRTLPIIWRNDIGRFDRICDHGVSHPDPSQYQFFAMRGVLRLGKHPCCGCCVPWESTFTYSLN